MNQSIETRMDSIEQQLKELRKEMEESIARYRAVQDGEKMPYYPFTEVDLKKLMCIKNTEIENVLNTKCPCDKCNEPVGFIPMTAQQWNDHCKKCWEEIKLEDEE